MLLSSNYKTEKAIVKFLFFMYSIFWYFYRACLAQYSRIRKQEGAISLFPAISNGTISSRINTKLQADTKTHPTKKQGQPSRLPHKKRPNTTPGQHHP
jgi:hypothetical protein